ncbi:MAG: DUF481 domain-containing protein [Myxococcota bacterium]
MNALALLTFSAINLGTAGYTLAQPPEGKVSQDPASSGSTELGSGGTFADVSSEDEKAADDATELTASVGGFLSTGNAESAAATALIKFRLRRNVHQFRAEAAANYGQASVPNEFDDNPDPEQTVGNIQGMVRYDWFFSKRWSLFAQVTGRNDPFQDLDLRMNVDPGFSFYALTKADHRLWFEAGYDFQYDIRTDEIVDETAADPERENVEKTFTNHAARLFAGYTNNLNEHVTFDTGLEYLQSVIDPSVFRINWATALTASFTERLSLSTTFTLRYENEPVAPKELDTITSVLLGVRFF